MCSSQALFLSHSSALSSACSLPPCGFLCSFPLFFTICLYGLWQVWTFFPLSTACFHLSEQTRRRGLVLEMLKENQAFPSQSSPLLRKVQASKTEKSTWSSGSLEGTCDGDIDKGAGGRGPKVEIPVGNDFLKPWEQWMHLSWFLRHNCQSLPLLPYRHLPSCCPESSPGWG